MDWALEFEEVVFSVPGRTVFDRASFRLRSGAKAVVSGPSGAGKSCLLKLLCGVYAPRSGIIRVGGVAMAAASAAAIRRHLCYLPQKVAAEDWDEGEAFVMLPFGFAANRSLRPTRRELVCLLESLGLEEAVLSRKMGELSGGERQRLALARGLLTRRDILLLDEPNSALDPDSTGRVVALVAGLDSTVVAVSHGDAWNAAADTLITVGGDGQVGVVDK